MRLLDRKQMHRPLSFGLLLILVICAIATLPSTASRLAAQTIAPPPPKPAPAPARWRGLIGEYGPDDNVLIILEKDGKLFALFKRTDYEPLDEVSKNVFKFPTTGANAGQQLAFTRDAPGRATRV